MDYNAIIMDDQSLISNRNVYVSDPISEACMQQDISHSLTVKPLSETKSHETSQHKATESM